jgi:TetR/AcrR family transcriptional regulator, transcriptional repressor for nem operon
VTQTKATIAKLTLKGERTRQRIVEGAAALIYEHGVANTTVDDVRSAVGVSSSQLYHYFRDKDELVRAVIAQQAYVVVGAQERHQFDTLEGLRNWREFVVRSVRRQRGRGGCPLGSLGSELADTDSGARGDVSLSFDRWEAAVRDGLRAMKARGALKVTTNPDDLALATLAALQGGLLLAKIHRSVKPVETALDAMIALIEMS